ncbi:HAD hydrolase family protein [Acidipila rosea]|uniref:HAD hydrolase family protein n=1 Tax=Acidipila rosea TaxID=768535 RepID=UPI001A9EB7B7|nr:HAD hydrolase family protein [Acidipila rosea]
MSKRLLYFAIDSSEMVSGSPFIVRLEEDTIAAGAWMRFLAVALDYDGTIAKSDVLDAEVRQAIASLRAQNIVIVIVTGRILSELERVAGDLQFVDAVVAENGAVIYVPESGYSKLLGEPPSALLLNALRLEGVAFKSGQSIIEADAKDAPLLLEKLRVLELPLALIFNRGRVMVLGQAISKATGLREMFKILRLSPHNAVAIGDAENDHELLRSCEIGTAVAWGSPVLMATADYVLPGKGPEAVADYLLTLASSHQIPTSLKTRRSLLLGYTDAGDPFTLAVRGRTVLVAGDTKSGKSWAAGLLCEQLILFGYSLLIVDPEGDYTSLEALPGVIVFGGEDPLPRPRDLLRALRHGDVSVVIDLSHTPQHLRLEYVRNLLPSIATLRHYTGLPHRIVVDEAHYFLHDEGSKGLLDLDARSYILVSYRASKLHPSILANVEAVIVTRESDPAEIATLRNICGAQTGRMSEADWMHMFAGMAIGEAAALPITLESEGEVTRIHLAPRLTPHVRHVAKYIDIPVSEGNQFVFWRYGQMSDERARSLRQLVSVLETWPASALADHLKRNDLSRWIADVFGDYPLAKTIEKIENASRSGTPNDVSSDMIEAIRTRYDFVDPLSDLH